MEIIFDETKNRQIMVRISEEDYQFITAIAKDRKLTQSTVSRGLIEASLRELRKLPITGKKPLFKEKL